MGTLRNIKFKIGKLGLVRFCFNRLREHHLLKVFYNDTDSEPAYKGIVFCVDGHIQHGGFADRMFGLLQTYALSKISEQDFRLFYNYPFDISNFLIPNNYDWKIDSNDISYNKRYSKPDVQLGNYSWIKSIPKSKEKQIHFYANVWLLEKLNSRYNTNYTYCSLYNELFKPSELLVSQLSEIKSRLPAEYISICFRHQNTFGDFSESNFKEISSAEKELLLKKCMRKIIEIQAEYNLPAVVTSDSLLFLKAIADMRDVYTILKADRIVHMGYTDSADLSVYMQSFIDFYILGGGYKVFQILSAYNRNTSGFPYLAALCSQKEFKTIFLE